MTGPDVRLHHGSHRSLLSHVDRTPDRVALDAIVVPSFRPAAYLDHVIELGARMGCVVLVLCSGRARAADAVARAAGVDDHVVAIDTPGLHAVLPVFRTDSLPDERIRRRRVDTSFKRNLGLLISRVAGWRRIAFLDDDIVIRNPDDLRAAAGLVGRYDAVGLRNEGFPDNSVVCHAHRAAGGSQDCFIGGGAMVLDPQRASSFFPNIYNEDWFFLLDEERLGSVGEYGAAIQKRFDPYALPGRARGEEFGDCLAEGVFWLLDQGGRIRDADAAFWAHFLARRGRLIDDIIARVRSLPVTTGYEAAERDRMLASLRAAQGRRTMIKPADCVAYLDGWRQDRRTWRRHLRRHAQQPGLAAALKALAVPEGAIAGLAPQPGRRGASAVLVAAMLMTTGMRGADLSRPGAIPQG